MYITRSRWSDSQRSHTLNLGSNENQDRKLQEILTSNIGVDNFSRYTDLKAVYTCCADIYSTHPDNISISHGSEQSIGAIIQSTSAKILEFPDPTFGMVDVYCDLYEKRKYKIGYSYDILTRAFQCSDKFTGSEDRLLYVASPDNFTGSVVCLSQITEYCSLYDTVIIDCAYLTIEEVVELYNQTIAIGVNNLYIVHTMSKLYGAANIRIGVTLSTAHNINKIQQFKPMCEITSTGAMFLQYLYSNPQTFVDSIDRNVQAKIDLEKIMVRHIASSGCRLFSVFTSCDNLLNQLQKISVGYREFHIGDEKFIRITTPDINDIEAFKVIR